MLDIVSLFQDCAYDTDIGFASRERLEIWLLLGDLQVPRGRDLEQIVIVMLRFDRTVLFYSQLNDCIVKVLARVLYLPLLIKMPLALVNQVVNHAQVLANLDFDIPVGHEIGAQAATFHLLYTERLVHVKDLVASGG